MSFREKSAWIAVVGTLPIWIYYFWHVIGAALSGTLDGDAVFFSRSLTLTGDMEAMLALRNALDDCGFDLPTDLAPTVGPFAPVFRQLAQRVREHALAGIA